MKVLVQAIFIYNTVDQAQDFFSIDIPKTFIQQVGRDGKSRMLSHFRLSGFVHRPPVQWLVQYCLRTQTWAIQFQFRHRLGEAVNVMVNLIMVSTPC